MNVEDIRRLIELASQQGVASLEVTVGNARVRIEMRADGAGALTTERAAPTFPPPRRRRESQPAAASAGHAVRATTDGIVHLQASPGAPAFVREGQAVGEADTVCLIEVMKTFHPVPAGRAGTVRAIRVSQGQVVAFDDVLVELT